MSSSAAPAASAADPAARAAALSDEARTALEAATTVLKGARNAVLTGAGVSTDSGIPDYRGAGAPVRPPMTYSQFLADDTYRRRYWAGSHLGWKRFSEARPNDGHRTLAELEAEGVVAGIITQNVDGLHVRAGSRRVVDLHGSMDRVTCLHQCARSVRRSPRSVRHRCVGIGPRHPAVVGRESLVGDTERRVHSRPLILQPDLIGQLHHTGVAETLTQIGHLLVGDRLGVPAPPSPMQPTSRSARRTSRTSACVMSRA